MFSSRRPPGRPGPNTSMKSGAPRGKPSGSHPPRNALEREMVALMKKQGLTRLTAQKGKP